MKKRAMKKWIPNGIYCHGNLGSDYNRKRNPPCKWLKYITTKNSNTTNCEFTKQCKGVKDNKCGGCSIEVYRCEYMNYTDWEEDSYLWDECKECGIKDNWY